MTIVRAFDLGHGGVKGVKEFYPASGRMDTFVFPAIAHRLSGKEGRALADSDDVSGVLTKRNTHIVTVNGVEYEVGHDVLKAVGGSESGRTLDGDYSKTSSYLALSYGALAEMNVDLIDVLVIGLPLSTLRSHRADLTKLMTGVHEISPGRYVEIKKVLVVAQPLGGFYNYGVSNKLMPRLREEVSLVIDPGYFTLDWIVVDGTVQKEVRSQAVEDGGVASILNLVAKQIEADLNLGEGYVSQNARTLDSIDAAFRNNKQVRIGRFTVDVCADYLKLVHERCAENMSILVRKVESTSDIHNIILVGGGAHFYEPVAQKLFAKTHDVIVDADPVFGNVKGYQFIGLHVANQK